MNKLAIVLTTLVLTTPAQAEVSAYDTAVQAGAGIPLTEYTGIGKATIAYGNLEINKGNYKLTGKEFIEAFNKYIPTDADYNLVLHKGDVILVLPNGKQKVIYDKKKGLTKKGEKFAKKLNKEINKYISGNNGDIKPSPIVEVPEPSSLIIMGIALVFLASNMFRAKRKKT